MGVYLLVLAAVLAISVRRLSELGLAGAPRALWVPFARPLLGVALEMALQVGLPAALVGARALGLRLRWIAVAAFCLVGVHWAGVARMEAGALAPGQLIQELLDRARESCGKTPERRVEVPLAGATWHCPGDGKPILVAGSRVASVKKLSVSSVRVSSDLRQLELRDLEVVVPPLRQGVALQLVAARARIRGLPPWGRPADSPTGRRLALSAFAAGLTLLAALLAQARLKIGFWVSVAIGVMAGACLVLTQRSLDRLGVGFSGYALAVFSGPVSVGLLSGILALTRSLRTRG